jgi:hypothetical protein
MTETKQSSLIDSLNEKVVLWLPNCASAKGKNGEFFGMAIPPIITQGVRVLAFMETEKSAREVSKVFSEHEPIFGDPAQIPFEQALRNAVGFQLISVCTCEGNDIHVSYALKV